MVSKSSKRVILIVPIIIGPLPGYYSQLLNGMNHQIVKVVTSIFHFLCALRGKGAKGHHATPQPDTGGWSDAIAHLTEVQIWPWFDHDYHPLREYLLQGDGMRVFFPNA